MRAVHPHYDNNEEIRHGNEIKIKIIKMIYLELSWMMIMIIMIVVMIIATSTLWFIQHSSLKNLWVLMQTQVLCDVWDVQYDYD